MYVDENMDMVNIKENEDHLDGSQANVDGGNVKSNTYCLLKRKSDVIESDGMIDGNDHDQVQCGLNKSVKFDVVIVTSNKEILSDEFQRSHFSTDEGSHCSVDNGSHCSVDDGSSDRVLLFASNDTITEMNEGNNECNSDKREYPSTEDPNENNHTCDTCGGRFFQTNNQKIHNFIHTDNKAHKCDSCDQQVTSKYNLKNQLTRNETATVNSESIAHSNVNNTSDCCEVSIKEVIRNINDGEGIEITYNEKYSRCIEIHKSSRCKNEEQDEMKYMQQVDGNAESANSFDPPEKSQIEASTQTDFQSGESNVILINIIKRLQETISVPEVSHEESTKSEEKGKIARKHHQCTICNKTFQHKRSMKDHENAHKGEKPYSCSICNEAFSRRTSLQQHRSVHSDVKLHQCDICEKAFSRKYDLKNHQLVHTGEQPYKCETCSKGFKRRHGLNRHMLLHAEGNSYTCELCTKTFYRKPAFIKHLSLHKNSEVEV